VSCEVGGSEVAKKRKENHYKAGELHQKEIADCFCNVGVPFGNMQLNCMGTAQSLLGYTGCHCSSTSVPCSWEAFGQTSE
jgi:hypothetical protein